MTLGNQVGQYQLGAVGAVGEGDLLNALVLQIAQRPEGAGENGAVGLGCQGQNAVRGFRWCFSVLPSRLSTR